MLVGLAVCPHVTCSAVVSELCWCQPLLLEEEAWRALGDWDVLKSRKTKVNQFLNTLVKLYSFSSYSYLLALVFESSCGVFFFKSLALRFLIWIFTRLLQIDSALSECRRVFVLFCPIIIQTISLPCSLPLQGAEGTQPLLCLLISSYILLGSFCFLYLFFLLSIFFFFFTVVVYGKSNFVSLSPFCIELPCMHHMGHIAIINSSCIWISTRFIRLMHFID